MAPNLISRQFLANLKKQCNCACILLQEFTLISKFDATLFLQIRFESDRLWPISFQKVRLKFWTQSAVSVQFAILLYESVSTFERKLFPRGKKLQNPKVSQVNQLIKAWIPWVSEVLWIFTYIQLGTKHKAPPGGATSKRLDSRVVSPSSTAKKYPYEYHCDAVSLVVLVPWKVKWLKMTSLILTKGMHVLWRLFVCVLRKRIYVANNCH